MEHGHPDARLYPLGMLSDEVLLIVERHNARMVAEAQLLQAAVGGLLDKKASKAFREMLKDLNLRTKPLVLEEESSYLPASGDPEEN